MNTERFNIENIPAILWGDRSDKVYIYVHGKMSSKADAEGFAKIAVERGYQVLSFDLPEHGDRKNENDPCNVWNGVRDLEIVGRYVYQNWKDISLFACSLGAYFSLLTYQDMPFKKCMFLSPILNMEQLIKNMMLWFDVTEETLKEKQIIQTPMGEPLDWNYYCYVKEHPIIKWNKPTAILYGSEDNLTEREVVDNFVNRFGCDLTILQGSEHYFHTHEQLAFSNQWIINEIS